MVSMVTLPSFAHASCFLFQMLLFSRILPLLIPNWVPDDNKHWENFLLLINGDSFSSLMEIVMQPSLLSYCHQRWGCLCRGQNSRITLVVSCSYFWASQWHQSFTSWFTSCRDHVYNKHLQWCWDILTVIEYNLSCYCNTSRIWATFELVSLIIISYICSYISCLLL